MTLLKTERLNIRYFEVTDANFILRLVNEPSFHQNIGDRKVRTIDDAVAYINNRFVASYSANGYGLYMIELKDGTPVGMCGLVKRNADDDPDVGFAFIPQAWRQGYAFEAGTAVIDYAKRKLLLPRVLGITIPGNTASIKTLEKLGLRFLQRDFTKDTNEPICIYEIRFECN